MEDTDREIMEQKELEEAEWRLKCISFEDNDYGVSHTPCKQAWLFSRVSAESRKCYFCKKKIPNYVILQWSILSGK